MIWILFVFFCDAWIVDAGFAKFSVQVHRGGFFVGHGNHRLYVNGKVNWFDHVETDTWSPLWLDQILELLSYYVPTSYTQKPNLMRKGEQFTYGSTLPLTCSSRMVQI